MRIVDEFSIRGLKGTLFVNDQKFELKLQNPSFELIIKYREGQTPSKSKIIKFLQGIPESLWIEDIARFEKMKNQFLLDKKEDFEDPEII